MTDQIPIKRALVSVYDKTGLAELALDLHAAGVELVSTGGSAALIAAQGIPVTQVEKLTGFPECLEGRVKTLHPRVHAGILADLRKEDHAQQLADLQVEPFNLVISNLYPFAATVASGASQDDCVEQIDIGGPSMVRAAAKNHPSVAIVTNPSRYDDVRQALQAGGFTMTQRQQLAAEAFRHTADYDVAVSTWMDEQFLSQPGNLPAWVGATFTQTDTLRYGENPHQDAALYVDGSGTGIAGGVLLHGKAMSYNNYMDGDAAYRAAYDHPGQPTVAVIKHANPCGIAVGTNIAEAHRKAHACDPVSAFGGIIATNGLVTADMAETVKDIFTEVVLAPEFSPEALDILKTKKNLRLLQVAPPAQRAWESRPISGGLLMQQPDRIDAAGQNTDADGEPYAIGDDPQNWRLVAGPQADEATLADLSFAWRSVRAVKSNAILLARDGASVGIGMGQVNRVDSCNLAVERAGGERAAGSVAASDAFFPFADGPAILFAAGVKAIVAPGGSIRDAEVIAAAQEAGVSLYFTGTRHFFH